MSLGDGTFVEAATPYGLDSLRDGRGLAASDFDGDGDLDFVVNNHAAAPHYFVNRVRQGRWLQVRLRGRESNRDGVGALVRARAGGRTFLRVVSAGDSYASQSSRTLHFGLGESERVEELEVRWPSGRRQVHCGIPAGRNVLVVEGEEAAALARGGGRP